MKIDEAERTIADRTELTARTDRSPEEWQIAGIEEGLASLARGEGVPHGDVKAWAASLSVGDKAPPI